MQLLDIKRMARNILENQNIESSFIEYKKSANFKDKILKTACAFANNYMNNEIGLLFIGIEEIDDKETGEKAIPKRPIEGIKESKVEGIENELKSLLANIRPKINYHIISDKLDGEYYLVVAVESGGGGPFQTSEKAEKDKDIKLKAGRYIRVGRDSRLPNPTEEFELLKKFAGFSFSSNLNDTATIDDLSYEYMKEYLLQTGAKKDIREMSKLDMAKSMGLVSESEYGGYRAKNFAVLMFAEMPNKFIPNAQVEIIREIDGTDKMESKRFDGPVWIQAKQVSKYFEDNIMASYTIRESDKIEHKIIYNYPLTAFEELATNAILHKEYDTPEYVGIYIYKDRISFVNHNRPLPPVTIEALNRDRSFDRRQYLNKELKDMFFSLNLIESYGSGIRRAKDALIENGSPELKFYPDNDVDNYTNAVMEINTEFLKSFNGSSTKETTKETTKEKNNIQEQIVLLMKNNPSITAEQIANEIKEITADGVRYHIRNLKAHGIITREGSTKSGKWIVMK
ncbi:divergent AAA domain protein [Peptostreptococcus stomatis DSM 17678]|uniref:Divergent AAA domain protein n=1 Tax=Peptostreptococcus stomatis DSM 17678 TaxID=596315 RepID=E0E4C7_9FIRM|nr:helix-turn-helix domain-containing protein [Peptostreptococcus stomatis]EFM64245.1 divergent AAA domain protein [Peptostreptococcus stomatis DSM 17678]